jgi:general secretion pathway protein D
MLNKICGPALLGIGLVLASRTRTLPFAYAAGLKDGSPPAARSSDSPASKSETNNPVPSGKQVRQADDAYLQGAKQFARKNFEAAQRCFEQAVRLDAGNKTYALALLYAREALVSGLIQKELKARLAGDTSTADSLLAKAKATDPTNPQVAEEDDSTGRDAQPKEPLSFQLDAPIEFAPNAGAQSFHLRGDLQGIIRTVYNTFGIHVVLDPSVDGGKAFRFDVDEVDYRTACRILSKVGHVFAVPLQPSVALVAKDTKENRDALLPLVEETIYIPGRSQEQLTDLANLARSMFELNQLGVSTGSGSIAIRAPENVLRLVHGIYADMADRGADVLLDVNVYELDRTNVRNIGIAPPTSATAIDVASAAQKLIASNQTLLSQSIASGSLTLSGSAYQQELEEVAFLVAAGVSGSSTFTSLLGTVGSYAGVPLSGISIASATLNLLLNSTEVQALDAVQLRAGDREAVVFRVGSRYPILTAETTSSSSSAVATELAAAGVSSATIAQLVGSSGSTTSTPQIQFEDIGITLKITPQVVNDDDVRLALDFKLESLGGTGVSNIPILNSRVLNSTVTVRSGETTMLATIVSANETKQLDGVPELGDLPGFQSTDRSTDGTKNELLITVTPHIVRAGSMSVTDRRITVPK